MTIEKAFKINVFGRSNIQQKNYEVIRENELGYLKAVDYFI